MQAAATEVSRVDTNNIQTDPGTPSVPTTPVDASNSDLARARRGNLPSDGNLVNAICQVAVTSPVAATWHL